MKEQNFIGLKKSAFPQLHCYLFLGQRTYFASVHFLQQKEKKITFFTEAMMIISL
jgi:hypothetical protein